MTHLKTEELVFIGNDAVQNIARIKNASWGLLATIGAVFAFLVTNEELALKNFFAFGFPIMDIVFIWVVCWHHPKKTMKYRKRLKGVLGGFSMEARKIHGGYKGVDGNDCGDNVYRVFAFLYFLALQFLYSSIFPPNFLLWIYSTIWLWIYSTIC